MAFGWRGCNIGGGEEETKHHHQLTALIIQVTRETLSSRGGAIVLKPILKPIFIQLAKILMPISQLAEPFVCDQGGGTPLVSDLDQVAEEEAFQPGRWSPGGWRRCGVRAQISIKKDFKWTLRGSCGGHATFTLMGLQQKIVCLGFFFDHFHFFPLKCPL